MSFLEKFFVKFLLARLFVHWKSSTAGIATSYALISLFQHGYKAGMSWEQWLVAVLPGAIGIIVEDVKHLPKAAAVLILALGLGASGARAQSAATPPSSPTFPIQTFSATASAIALPGNRETTPGAITGFTLTVTQNFDLRNTNFVTTGANGTGYFGGVDYTIAPFSKWLNKISPNLDGYNFQLQATASAGVDRVTPLGTTGIAEHYSFLAGGRLNYAIAGSRNFGLGVDVEYAKLPGIANNTVIVSVGPTIHW